MWARSRIPPPALLFFSLQDIGSKGVLVIRSECGAGAKYLHSMSLVPKYSRKCRWKGSELRQIGAFLKVRDLLKLVE